MSNKKDCVMFPNQAKRLAQEFENAEAIQWSIKKDQESVPFGPITIEVTGAPKESRLKRKMNSRK